MSLGTSSPPSRSQQGSAPHCVRAAPGSVPPHLANPHPPQKDLLPNVQKGQSANFCLFLPNILSATAEKDFGAAVFVTTLPMQLGAVEYSAAGTLAALNTALLE